MGVRIVENHASSRTTHSVLWSPQELRVPSDFFMGFPAYVGGILCDGCRDGRLLEAPRRAHNLFQELARPAT